MFAQGRWSLREPRAPIPGGGLGAPAGREDSSQGQQVTAAFSCLQIPRNSINSKSVQRWRRGKAQPSVLALADAAKLMSRWRQ